MPCAAVERCKLQHNTPCPPNFTSHKCSECAGYLHGSCGVASPMGGNEMQRMCGKCVPNSASDTPTVSRKGKSALKKNNARQHKACGTAKRNRWTFEQQGEAIDMVRNKHMKAADVGKHFGVKLRTVERALEKAKEIKKILAEKPHLRTHKAIRDPQHPEMENAVLEMVIHAKTLKLPVNRATIHGFALKACDELREKAPSEEVREKYSNFRASTHWVANFLSRHDLVHRGLHKETSSMDRQAATTSRTPEIRNARESNDALCVLDGKGDNNAGNQEISPSLPSYEAVAEHMSALEEYAEQHPLPEFAYHLHKAKLSLLSSISVHSSRSGRQTDIRNFIDA